MKALFPRAVFFMVCALLCVPAHAAVLVSVDFNRVISGTPTPTYVGSYTPPTGGLGGVWNGLGINSGQNSTAGGTTYSGLVDSGGAATPYSLTIGSVGQNYGAWSYAHTPSNDLINDYLYEVDSVLNFTISGFDASESYLVTFHMYGNHLTSWTLGGTTKSGNSTTRYAVWKDIWVSGSTTFTGTINNANEFHGFQMEVTLIVPEPGTLGLFCSGLLALAFLRKVVAGVHA